MADQVLALADENVHPDHVSEPFDPNLLDSEFDAFDNLDGCSLDEYLASFTDSDDLETKAVTQSESDFDGEEPAPTVH